MFGKALISILASISGISALIYLIKSFAAQGKKFAPDGQRKDISLAVARYSMFLVFAGIIMASGFLMYQIINHNFSFAYVFSNSSRNMPFALLLSTFYAGQEGSFLLWLLFFAATGYVLFPKARKQDLELPVMGFFMLIVTFLLLLLIIKSPFNFFWESFPQGAKPGMFPQEGRGMNPILENYWMVIHPPILFIGYTFLAVPFVYALSALMKGEYSKWIDHAKPWILASGAVLGAGLMLGGFWAYETLGWGGFWGWDPVENSSLVPWIVAVALTHTISIQRKTEALKRTNLALALMAFCLVVYAVFLTRSGVLSDASVHSFENPGSELSSLLLAFLESVLAISLAMFVYRFRQIKSPALANQASSREFMLALGTAFVVALGALIIIGTSMPLLSSDGVGRAISGVGDIGISIFGAVIIVLIYSFFKTKSTAVFKSFLAISITFSVLLVVSLPLIAKLTIGGHGATIDTVFYNQWTLPIAIALLLSIALTVYLNWGSTSTGTIIRRLIAPVIVAAVATALASGAGLSGLANVLLFFAAVAALAANLEIIARKLIKSPRSLGAYITHVGVAVMMLGVLASGIYSESKTVSLVQNEPREALGLSLLFTGSEELKLPRNDRQTFAFNIEATRRGEKFSIRPEVYYSDFNGRRDPFFEPGIDGGIAEDVYISPKSSDNKYQLELSKDVPAKMPTDTATTIRLGGFDLGDMESAGQDSLIKVGAIVFYRNPQSESVDTLYTKMNLETMECFPVWKKLDGSDLLIGFTHFRPDQTKLSMSQVEISLAEGSPDAPKPLSAEVFTVEVARKPFVSLVWAGVVLVVLGYFWAMFKKSKTRANEPLQSENN